MDRKTQFLLPQGQKTLLTNLTIGYVAFAYIILKSFMPPSYKIWYESGSGKDATPVCRWSTCVGEPDIPCIGHMPPSVKCGHFLQI